jgi:four helix bundle protein
VKMERKEEIKSYRDLIVWQKSMTLVKKIYEASRQFPDTERYGLSSQIKRASISIPSNIAEGYGRNTTSDYLRFLRMSIGSLYELRTQLEIAWNENFLAKPRYNACCELCDEMERMLVVMVRKIGNASGDCNGINFSRG